MITLKFKAHTFNIKEVENGVYDLNHLRKQVQEVVEATEVSSKNVESTEVVFKSTQSMTDWKKYLSSKEKETYQLKSTRGRSAKTIANKQGLIAYAAWLNEDFKLAVEKAFVSATENDTRAVQDAVGSVYFDLEKALEVQERWKKFINWSYKTFGDINTQYGGNITRLVMKTSLGVSATQAVKGKADKLLVERLIEQKNFSAVLALDSTLTIIKNLLSIPLMKKLLANADKKKELYITFKTMLSA
ncbi:hypothetical protein B5G52_04160 [Pseudoalteromonas sp. A601]|uniref:hypothetical protein n=1 Tax=Pseudoalteromonas sp. A601 TaxID=1967839 RepID=UPI000B3C5501|nr:hypothetical protein [Pseudoalteromonas sp. A601]OUS73447.1 hypothetical protein B5G52_04160 [Pseudoalteromonas sp. A601]